MQLKALNKGYIWNFMDELGIFTGYRAILDYLWTNDTKFSFFKK